MSVNPQNGIILRQIRENIGLNGAQMAELLGVSFRTLRAWENAEKHCPLPILKLAQMLARQFERNS